MDYLEMLAFACIFLGGSMLIGLLAWLVHCWWIERAERKEQAADQQRDDEYYAGLHQALLRQAEEYAGLRESLLQHVDELIRKVDRP
jgi:hypothetical protein